MFLKSKGQSKTQESSATGAAAAAPENYDDSLLLPGAVEFRLLSKFRDQPRLSADMDGYYRGQVQVLRCPFFEELEGKSIHMTLYNNLISCAPFFVYRVSDACYFTGPLKKAIVVPESAGLLRPVRLIDYLTRDDLHYMLIEERATPFSGVIMNKLMKLPETPSECWRMDNFMQQPFVNDHQSIVRDCSDLTRLNLTYQVFELLLMPHNGSSEGQENLNKMRRRVYELERVQLEELNRILLQEPWLLCFPSVMRERFNKIPALSKHVYYQKALPQLLLIQKPTVTPFPPLHIAGAMAIFFECKEQQAQTNNTIFDRSAFLRLIHMCPMKERQELEQQAYDFLIQNNVIAFIDKKGDDDDDVNNALLFALKNDYEDAQSVVTELVNIKKRGSVSTAAPLTLRGSRVPHIYQALTDDQMHIAREHILTSWLTIVEGMPGTGKTSLIEFVFSHYRNVMLCTFVGMMAKALRMRCGDGRQEVAFTIHFLLTMARSESAIGRKWLAMYEVLVIDEFSNVSQHLLAKLLPYMTGVRKIILVGDHRQLKPIEPGDPMRDLSEIFGVHELTQNLRVINALKSLQEAPRLIATERYQQIHFDQNIQCIGRPASLVQLFQEANTKNVMDVHVVVLTNKGPNGRMRLNQMCEEAWIKLGVLKKKDKKTVKVRAGLELFEGCKVCFTRNNNIPYQEGNIRSDPVANGELAVVKEIRKQLGGFDGWRLVLLSGPDKEEKVVWVSKSAPKNTAVHPSDISLGYATTTYKTQGQQFPYVLFWNEKNPGPQWTRSHAYVAVSRAQKRCWIAGTQEEFFTICSKRDRFRRTCFSRMLQQHQHELTEKEANSSTQREKIVPVGDLVLIDRHEPCVPTLNEVMNQQNNKRQKR